MVQQDSVRKNESQTASQNKLNSGFAIEQQLIKTREEEIMSTTTNMQELYIGYFGRAADQDGLDYWVAGIDNGDLSYEDVVLSFTDSPLV